MKRCISLIFVMFVVFYQSTVFAQKKVSNEYVEESREDILKSINGEEEEIGGSFYLGLKRTTDKKYNGKPLEIYDNSEFKNKPVFTLTIDSILEGDKEINFQEFLNNIQDKEKLKTSQKSEGSLNGQNYKFVHFSKAYVSLLGKAYSDKYLQVEYPGKRYYLKITDELKIYLDQNDGFSYKNIFVEKKQQGELDRIINGTPDFRAFLDGLKKCVKVKDDECLFKYQAIIRNSYKSHIEKKHYKNVFLIRQILDDPSLCKKWYETRSRDFEGDDHIPKGFEKIVNKNLSSAWDSIEKALSFDLDYNYVNLSTDKIKDKITEVRIKKKRLKHLNCGYDNHDTVNFYFSKEPTGWKIILFALTPYDFAD